MSIIFASLFFLWVAATIDGVLLWQLLKSDVHPLIAIPVYLLVTAVLAVLYIWAVILTAGP